MTSYFLFIQLQFRFNSTVVLKLNKEIYGCYIHLLIIRETISYFQVLESSFMYQIKRFVGTGYKKIHGTFP